MQSSEILLAALATILIGAAALYYQRTGTRKFEFLITFFGVAFLASGIAMFRDGVEGSRKFLWMLPSSQAAVAAQSNGNNIAANTPAVTRSAHSD